MNTAAQSKNLPDSHAVAVRIAVDAVDMARLGEAYVDDLRVMLLAIFELTSSGGLAKDVVRELARVGYDLVCGRHNELGVAREGAEDRLLALRETTHGRAKPASNSLGAKSKDQPE